MHFYERRDPSKVTHTRPTFPRRSEHKADKRQLNEEESHALQSFKDQVRGMPQNTVRSKLKYSAGTLPIAIYAAATEQEELAQAGVRHVMQDNKFRPGTLVIFPGHYWSNDSLQMGYYSLGRVSGFSLGDVTIRVYTRSGEPNCYEETLIPVTVPMQEITILICRRGAGGGRQSRGRGEAGALARSPKRTRPARDLNKTTTMKRPRKNAQQPLPRATLQGHPARKKRQKHRLPLRPT